MFFIYENRYFLVNSNVVTLKYHGENYIIKLDEALKELTITRESNRLKMTFSILPIDSNEAVEISVATGDVVNLDAYLPIAEYASNAESIEHEDLSKIVSENFDTIN